MDEGESRYEQGHAEREHASDVQSGAMETPFSLHGVPVANGQKPTLRTGFVVSAVPATWLRV